MRGLYSRRLLKLYRRFDPAAERHSFARIWTRRVPCICTRRRHPGRTRTRQLGPSQLQRRICLVFPDSRRESVFCCGLSFCHSRRESAFAFCPSACIAISISGKTDGVILSVSEESLYLFSFHSNGTRTNRRVLRSQRRAIRLTSSISRI